jgi:hypothetical protein
MKLVEFWKSDKNKEIMLITILYKEKMVMQIIILGHIH